MNNWLLLIAGILSNASASICIKLAMTPPRHIPSLKEPLSILYNGPFCLGLLLYGSTLVLYAAALMHLPLHIAHPILTAGAIVVVALSSIYILEEPCHWHTILGIVLVLTGIVLMTARKGL